MKLSGRIKPISYLKAHASEVLRGLEETREPMIITLNGEAKAVLQDVASFEQTQETLALLKMLALGDKSIGDGRVMAAGDAFAHIRRRVNK